MNYKAKAILTVALITCLQLLNAYSQEMDLEKPAPAASGQEAALQALVSTNGEQRLRAAMQLDQDRDRLIQLLIAVLNSTNHGVGKIEAVIVLGEYRAVEAVPILVDHMEWDEAGYGGGVVNGPLSREASERKSSMAVFSALHKIGMPAIPALLNKILKTDNSKIAKKCVVCCCVIEGIDTARFRFESHIKSEANQVNKQKMESALKILNNLKVSKNGSIIADW